MNRTPAAIVFGDRCTAPFEPSLTECHDLDDGPCGRWLDDRPASFGAAVAVPLAPALPAPYAGDSSDWC